MRVAGKRRGANVTTLIVAAMTVLGVGVSCRSKSLGIVSASRTILYTDVVGVSATNKDRDVVLVLQLSGVGRDQFEALSPRYVESTDGRRWSVDTVFPDHGSNVVAAAVIANDAEQLTLVVADLPRMPFRVDKTVQQQMTRESLPSTR